MSWNESFDSADSIRRIRQIRLLIVVTMLALLARLWWVQIARGDLFQQLSEGVRMRHLPLQAPRGRIYDRSGELLAANSLQFTVVLDPVELRRHSAAERDQIFARVSSILNIPVSDIQDVLSRSRREGLNTIRVKSGVGPTAITRMLEQANDLSGFDVERVPVRSYPRGGLGCHVLGYVGEPTAADLKRYPDYSGADQVGEQGLERSYETALHGRDGTRVIEVNARGAPVSGASISKIDPVPGNDLVLSLDGRLQWAAQGAFAPGQRGSVVAVDVQTGGILALASKPGFDPETFVQDAAEARKARAAYLLDPAGPMQDRAVMSRYPPGSTFKIVTSAAGFTDNVIQPSNRIWCAGGLRLGGPRGEWKKCWAFHGSVDYRRAIADSCDSYFYDLMRRLPTTHLAAMAHAMGLGEHTGIDLQGDSPGFVPDPAWKDRRFKHERWWFGDACNLAIGQGYLLTTSLQMALVTATIANGGYRLRPYLVSEVRRPGGQLVTRTQPEVIRTIADGPAGLAKIREAMRSAVSQGTAGVVRFRGLEVAAKTGSAQDRRDQPTHAWFVCFAPYDHPRIAICAMVEHGGHGGSAAGPIAREILKAYFHLRESDAVIIHKTD